MSVRERSGGTRSYRRPISRTWWLRNIRYTIFMLREFSSVFVALFAILYIIQFALLIAGVGPYNRYLALLRSPAWVFMNIVFFVFAVIHTLTWFSLVPRVTPVRMGKRELPGRMVWLGAVGAWVGVSVVIAVIVLLVF